MTTESKISKHLKELEALLLYKNKKYNNSLHNSEGYFSNLPPVEKIKSRVDDKINRIKKSESISINDLLDLQGYLVHLTVALDNEIDYKKYYD